MTSLIDRIFATDPHNASSIIAVTETLHDIAPLECVRDAGLAVMTQLDAEFGATMWKQVCSLLKTSGLPHVKVNYSLKCYNGIPLGRWYADAMAYQRMKGCLRRLVGGGLVCEIDIANSHPCILAQLCRDRGFPQLWLEAYIANRETFLSSLMNTYNVSRDDAKQYFVQTIYGSNFTMWIKDVRPDLYPKDADGCLKDVAAKAPGKKITAAETKALLALRNADVVYYEEGVKLLFTDINNILGPTYGRVLDAVTAQKMKDRVAMKRGCSLSILLQNVERRIVDCLLGYCADHGLVVRGIIHDSVMVDTGSVPLGCESPIITQLQDHVFDQLGLRMGFDVKPLARKDDDVAWLEHLKEITPTAEVVASTHNAALVQLLFRSRKDLALMDDTDAARMYVRYVGRENLVKCCGVIHVFDKHTGLWSSDADDVRRAAMVMENDIPQVKISCHLSNMLKEVPSCLVANDTWVSDTTMSTVGKLHYTNGIYDMDYNDGEGKFLGKSAFSPSLVFHGTSMRRDFVSREDVIQSIYDRLNTQMYSDPFEAPEVGAYLRQLTSRAISGHVERVFVAGCGRTASGKTVLTIGAEHAFPGVVGTFSAANLICKQTAADDAQANRWVLNLHHKRLIISNEVKGKVTGKDKITVDGNAIKSLSSGGDRITGRHHCQEEVAFVPCFIPMMLLNEMPDIEPMDDAVRARLRTIYMPKTCVNSVEDVKHEFHMVGDPDIKQKLATPEYYNALMHILLDAYREYRCEQRGIDRPPALVLKYGEVFCGSSFKALFLRDFIVTNQSCDRVGIAEFQDWAEGANVGFKPQKLKEELLNLYTIRPMTSVQRYGAFDRFCPRTGMRLFKDKVTTRVYSGFRWREITDGDAEFYVPPTGDDEQHPEVAFQSIF